MALVAELVTELKVNSTGFHTAMKAAAVAVTAVAAAGVALYKTIDVITARIDEMTKSADRLGIAVEAFQGLQYAADLANVSTGELQVSLKKLMKGIDDANHGGSKMQETFARLGLSSQELAKMPLDKAYEKVLTAMSKLQSKQEQGAIALTLFSKAGLANLSMMKDGVADIIKEYEGYNLALSATQARNAEMFQDAKTRLETVFGGFSGQVAAEVAPAFTVLFEGLQKSLTGTTNLRDAAKTMAMGIVNAIQFAVRSFDALLSILDQVIDKMNQIQPLQRLEMARQFAINAVSGAGFSTNPNMIGSLSPQAAPSSLGGSSSDAIAALEKVMQDLSNPLSNIGELAGGLVKGFDVAGSAVAEFAQKAQAASSMIGSLLGSSASGKAQEELQRILGDRLTGGDTPQFKSEMFDERFRQIYDDITQGRTIRDSRWAGLTSEGTGPKGITDSTANIGAIADLRKYAAEMAGTKPMKLTINVSTDKGFNLDVATSPEINAMVTGAIRQTMASEARIIGR